MASAGGTPSAGAKRPAEPAVSAASGADEVLDWLRHTVLHANPDAADRLIRKWQEDGVAVDGKTLLTHDLTLLTAGCSVAVKSKIQRAVQALRGEPQTQALAPITQPHGGSADTSQENRPPKEQQGGGVRREPPRRAPATQLDPSPLPGAGAALIKPDPEQVAAEAEAEWQQMAVEPSQRRLSQRQPDLQQPSRRTSRRQRSQPPEGEAEVQQQQEQAEAEGMEVEDEPQQEEMDEEEPEPEEAVVKEEPLAIKEGPLAMSTRSGRATRSASRRQQSQQPKQEQRMVEAEEEEEEEPGEELEQPRRATRRQRLQQEEQVAAAGARARSVRGRTLAQREQREAEEAAARREDEEDEDEAMQAEGTEPAVDSDDDDEEEALVTEDLGPEAPEHYYLKDWTRRAKWGLAEIFSSMSVNQLRDMINEQEENGAWPEVSLRCLQKKKTVDGQRGQWVELTKSKAIANKLVNFIFTGDPDGKHQAEDGALHQRAIKELLKTEHCDHAVKVYVRSVLSKRYQNLPRYADPHKLMWKLWHYPMGPANGDIEILLGTRTMQYEAVTAADLEPRADDSVRWRAVYNAVKSGTLVLADHENQLTWFDHVNDLYTHPRIIVSARLTRTPGNRTLKIFFCQTFLKDSPSYSLVSGTWERTVDNEPEIVAVDLVFVLGELDGMAGSPFMEQMSRLVTEFEQSADEVVERGVEPELLVGNPINFQQFDKVMSCVENIDGGEPEDFKQTCDDEFLLTLRPYQRRALAHMLREERAEGGSARHLWVKLNLAEAPEVQVYVSPILHQIRASTSKCEIEAAVHATGGAGWIALQMGMGKTACAVGTIQLNPPPATWRANRTFQTLRRRDHLSAVLNNMPHGGTLIVMPPTLIDQWEDEIRKTTQAELSILKWTETTKGHPRTLDCKKIAQFDVVLCTFPLATQLHTLSHIRWWRIVVDEPQLQAGGFLVDKEHIWMSQHRWLLTGTPINATVETLGPSTEFLKLGAWDALYRYYPPVIAHVLKRAMVRFTKRGELDGEPNLVLPPLAENTVECELTEEDRVRYQQLRRDKRYEFREVLSKIRINPETLGENDPDWEERRLKLGAKMMKLRGMVTALRQAASSGYKMWTGEELYDDVNGRFVKEYEYFDSKVRAVIELLEDKDPDEKVLIFSEFPLTLKAIKSQLPGIGLGCRDIIGASSAAARGKAIRLFQTDPPTKVFLLTYKAGGAGVTLTAGTHIILCEPTLNPSFTRQAIGRSHRMGQDKPITVTRMLMKGTIEEQIKAFADKVQAQAGGDDAQDEALEPLDEQHLASTANEANAAANDASNKLTIEDLRDMLNPPWEEDE